MRDAIVREAREWVGTKYMHQASVKGAGADCVGLIRGVGFATGVLPRRDDDWKRFNAYGRLPNPHRMKDGMNTFLVPIADGTEQIGDIAWLEWRADLPMHLAILAEHNGRRTLIHALSDFRMVVEHGLTADWEARVSSWWRYPDIEQ